MLSIAVVFTCFVFIYNIQNPWSNHLIITNLSSCCFHSILFFYKKLKQEIKGFFTYFFLIFLVYTILKLKKEVVVLDATNTSLHIIIRFLIFSKKSWEEFEKVEGAGATDSFFHHICDLFFFCYKKYYFVLVG